MTEKIKIVVRNHRLEVIRDSTWYRRETSKPQALQHPKALIKISYTGAGWQMKWSNALLYIGDGKKKVRPSACSFSSFTMSPYFTAASWASPVHVRHLTRSRYSRKCKGERLKGAIDSVSLGHIVWNKIKFEWGFKRWWAMLGMRLETFKWKTCC